MTPAEFVPHFVSFGSQLLLNNFTHFLLLRACFAFSLIVPQQKDCAVLFRDFSSYARTEQGTIAA